MLILQNKCEFILPRSFPQTLDFGTFGLFVTPQLLSTQCVHLTNNIDDTECQLPLLTATGAVVSD